MKKLLVVLSLSILLLLFSLACEQPCTHSNSEEKVITAATCTEKGELHVVCKDCGVVISSAEIDALGHDYSWTIDENPTCTEAGNQSGVCKRDKSHTTTKTIDPIGHKWSDWNTTNATCEKDGSKTRTCSIQNCGANETETITALDHDFELVFEKGSSEIIPGYKYNECKRKECSHIEKKSIDIIDISEYAEANEDDIDKFIMFSYLLQRLGPTLLNPVESETLKFIKLDDLKTTVYNFSEYDIDGIKLNGTIVICEDEMFCSKSYTTSSCAVSFTDCNNITTSIKYAVSKEKTEEGGSAGIQNIYYCLIDGKKVAVNYGLLISDITNQFYFNMLLSSIVFIVVTEGLDSPVEGVTAEILQNDEVNGLFEVKLTMQDCDFGLNSGTVYFNIDETTYLMDIDVIYGSNNIPIKSKIKGTRENSKEDFVFPKKVNATIGGQDCEVLLGGFSIIIPI